MSKLHAFVPLVTYPDPNADAVARNAAAVAAALKAEIHAFALTVRIPPVSNALSRVMLDLPSMIREAEALSDQRAAHLLDEVAKAATSAGTGATKTMIDAPPASIGDVAATQARYFDISLIGWEAANEASRMIAEAVIFGSGRPVILMPELAPIDALDHIAIAWDGSRVSARAVADARPLLQSAAKVSVLTVIDEKPLAEKEPGRRLVDSLKRGGISAEIVELKAEDCAISETLQQRAIEMGGNLLVMGGYGHSRVRDFVLGGATEGVLRSLLLPILLSH
jgi:nucleotide-binding universal stress UspA family protein